MRLPFRRRWLLVPPALLLLVAAAFYPRWREATRQGGQTAAEPFRIAGNLYYVGASDVTAFLLAGPEGHVLIDGGYPGTAPMILRSVAQLGFDARDVKLLLNSHGHYDHAGGLAELQRATGAELWVSDAEADMVGSGGDSPDLGPLRVLVWSGISRYAAPRVHRRLRDGDTVRVGATVLVAHVTPGHTPGCTSWEIPLREGERALLAVHACSLGEPVSVRALTADPRMRAEFERSFRTLRALPADVWVTAHARQWGRYRKFVQRDSVADPTAPFVDPAGYRAFVDSAEARFRRRIAER